MIINDDTDRIEKQIQNDYAFEFEKYFSEGWEIFRKEPGLFIVYGLLAGIILSVIGLVPILGIVASMLISPPLYAGLYLGARKLDKGEKLEFGDFFKGFDDIVQLFLYTLIAGILITIATFLLILPGIWLGIAVTLAVPLILFTKLDFWESIKASVKLVNKKWFHFFALTLVLAVMNIFGALFLFVGLLVTVPLTFCISYSAYKDIVGFPSEDAGTPLEGHLVDDAI